MFFTHLKGADMRSLQNFSKWYPQLDANYSKFKVMQCNVCLDGYLVHQESEEPYEET